MIGALVWLLVVAGVGWLVHGLIHEARQQRESDELKAWRDRQAQTAAKIRDLAAREAKREGLFPPEED